jgi:hypothetical protein
MQELRTMSDPLNKYQPGDFVPWIGVKKQMTELRERIASSVGGREQLAGFFSWRTMSDTNKRAEREIEDAAEMIEGAIDGIAHELAKAGLEAFAEDPEPFVARAIRLWAAYQLAGSRTANPMVTGPARFPVERNRKRMETEHKRWLELGSFLVRAPSRAVQLARKAQRASLRAAGDLPAEVVQVINGVTLLEDPDDDRLRLIFDGKPEPDVIALLKSRGFRWSPTNTAWQRQLTDNARNAAQRILQQIAA